VILLERLGVFLTKFRKKKLETRHSMLAKAGRFKQPLQIHCIKISGEAASADIEATCMFTADFKNIIEDNDFPPDLVFIVDETGL
jgi:hypothetical protein